VTTIALACTISLATAPRASAAPLPVPAADAAADSVTALAFITAPTTADPGTPLEPEVVVEVRDGDTATTTSAEVVLTLARVGDSTGSLTCTSTTAVPGSDGRATFADCKVDKGGTYTLTATLGTLTATSPLVVSGPAILDFITEPSGGAAGAVWATQPSLVVADAAGVAVTRPDQDFGVIIKPGTGTPGATLTCTTNVVTSVTVEPEDAEASADGEVTVDGEETADGEVMVDGEESVEVSQSVATFAGCTIDKAGTGYQLLALAKDDQVAGTSAAFSIDAGPAVGLRFVAEPVGGAVGGIAGQPVVAVVDAGGNTVTSDTTGITLIANGPAGATISCNTTATIAGVASFTGCSVSAPGTYTLTASAAGLTAATSATFTVIPGGLARLTFSTQPGGGAGGQAFATQPVVTLSDAGGSPATGIVTLTLSGGSDGAALLCNNNPAVSTGNVATFSGCFVDAVGTGYVLTATSGGVTATSSPFDVTAGGITTLEITAAPSSAVGGSPVADVVVKAYDAGGNPAAGSVALALVPELGTEGAVLTCPTPTATVTLGVATFAGCSIDLAGNGYRMQATVTGTATAIDTTEAIDVSVGAAHHLDFRTPPGGGTGGTALEQQPVVAVEDAGGNLVVGSAAVVDVALTGVLSVSASLTCASTLVPVTSGSALFAGCSVDKTGVYTLIASSAGLAGATSPEFAVVPGPASQLLLTRQPQRGALGTVVMVADAGGNPAVLASGDVGLTLTPGTGVAGASASCAGGRLAASLASFSCSVGVVGGGYTFTARYGDLRAESLPFNVVPVAPAALGKAPKGVPVGQTFGGRLYGNNPTDVQDSVNTATGSLHTSVTDLQVAGVGEDLVLTRTYNSADTASGAFGPGWSSVLDLSVTINKAGTTATVRGEDGQRLVFTKAKGSNTWVAPPGARAALTCTAKNCTVTRYDGIRFEVAGNQLVSYSDANGQGLRFTYAGGQLSEILVATTDVKQPQIVAVTTASGRVSSLRTPAGWSVSYSYDDDTGVLTDVTDVLGQPWRYGHAESRLSRITDPDGTSVLTVGYDGSGRVTSVVDGGSARRADSTFAWSMTNGTGNSTRSVATATGRASYVDQYIGNVLVGQTLPEGRGLRYGYDASTNLTHVQDPAGWVQVMTYDTFGHMLSHTSPLGGGAVAVQRMTYDAQHRLISQTDADGRTTTYVYNGANLGSIRPPGPGEGATRMSYDSVGLLVSTTTPIGRQVFTSDTFGNTVRTVEQDLAGLPLNGAGSTATFDEAGRTTSVRSALDIESTWQLDAAGKVLRSSTPTGDVTNTYSNAGTTRSSTAFGETTTYAWNEGSLTLTTSGPGGTSTQQYDGSGNALRETSATGLVTEHTYDGLGREYRTTTGTAADPDAISSVRYFFDDASNVVRSIDDNGDVIDQQFDALSRVVRQASDGLESWTSYDGSGNVTMTRDGSGGVATRTYDLHGNASTVKDAQGTTTYAYDLADNLVGRTDSRGGVTTWTYDPMSRPTSMTVGGQRTTYAYDLDGRLVMTTDPEGRSTTLELDSAGNPTETRSSGAGYQGVVVRQTFDGRGRRTSLDGVPVRYDARGNVVAAAGFSYDYGTPGTVVETYPGGKQVTYDLDEAGNLMSVRSGTEGEAGYVAAAYMRDGERRATGLALSNGVLQTRAFDEDGNLLDQTVRLGGSVLAHDAYTWDQRGNRMSQRSSALGQTVEHGYAYEASGRLAGASTTVKTGLDAEVLEVGLPSVSSDPTGPVVGVPTGPATGVPAEAVLADAPVPGAPIAPAAADLRYDAVGNRTSADGRQWTYGPADQIVTDSSGTRWTYDRSGAVTSRSGGNKPSATYTYDAAARLLSVSSGGTTVTYGYDGDGNRISRSGDGPSTSYSWSPFGFLPQLAQETTGGVTTSYIHGEGPIAQQTGDDVLFFHLDPIGSTNAVTDAAGTLVAAYHYSAYGEVVGTGDRADDVDLLFHAQQLDRVSGLYNMRARQYDPDTGRFTQREPAITPVGMAIESAYAFVGNQPTVRTDPTGRTISSTTVFAGQTTQSANDVNNAKLGLKVATPLASRAIVKAPEIALKVATKVFGYVAKASAASSSAAQVAKAAEKAKVLKGVGFGFAVVGIALQTYVTVENCMNGPVEKCVGSAVGLAINVGFTLGCLAISSGAGSIACAIVGAALGVSLEYVITEYGPQIVNGLIDGYLLAAPWVSDAALVTAAAFVDFGNDVAQAATDSVGAIVVAFDDAAMAVESGYLVAIDVLSAAGLDALEFAQMVVDVFDVTGHDVVALLFVLSYGILDASIVLDQVFTLAYEETAAFLVDGFSVATTEVATALTAAYDITAQELTTALAAAGVAVTEIAVALAAITELTAQGIADLLDEAEYGFVAVGAALQDSLDLAAVELVKVLATLDASVLEVAGVLRDVADELGAAAAATFQAAGVFFAVEVAQALDAVYAETAAGAAAALEAAGYVVDDVATALQGAYAASAAEVTQLLKDVEFTSVQIAGALESVYGEVAEGAALLLHDVGFSVLQVADALEQEFLLGAALAAGFLEDAGYSFVEVGEALETTFEQTVNDAADVLVDLGATTLELALVLQVSYDQSAAEMAAVFEDIEVGANDTAVALEGIYGQTAAGAAQLLEDAGYSFEQIGTALDDVFNQTANETASLLASIGASASEVVDILGATFGVVGPDVLNGILVAAGYAADTINAIGGAFEDFGNDVADFFSDLF
jgi:RHS repeat-associated protein